MNVSVIEREPEVKAASLDIRIVDPLTIGGWDEQVRMLPDATVFHSAGWARVLHETYGYRPLYLTAVRGHELAGVLPLMEINSWLTGKRGVSLPFSDFCPPLATAPDITDALRARALNLARDRQWRYIELRGLLDPTASSVAGVEPRPPRAIEAGLGGPGSTPADLTANQVQTRSSSPGPHSHIPHPASIPRAPDTRHLTPLLHHSLDLTPGPDALFASFSSSTRRAIRKSESEALDITIDSALGSVRAFHDLNGLTRRRHGLPPQSFRFFRAVHRHLLSQGLGFVVTARHLRRPIAAAVFLRFGAHALYKYGASDERYQALRANNRVMWEGIQACARQGATLLSLGKTEGRNEGLRRFKLGWGATEQILLDLRLHAQTGQPIPTSETLHGWHNRIFQRLPVALNRGIGTILYPHIG